ncbi:MAG: hypothetical protein HON47_03645 [Candidatus Diapherotrites archaeon]|jgi:uncharacterized protein|uniref:Lon proteolytic domain-containing protein n=1 Tax=Candidatus Iainarchaeum sp. TaxID=3101447 RepID=A0A8T5GF88_9ARCH|nr:hypothetical protein [Candidatus Diapherotrites archaeon]MBT7240870.1 hypothetical protein [Candidatus Diapherotrites archaeon]
MRFKLLLVFVILVILSTSTLAISANGDTKIFAVTEDEKGMAADLFLYSIPGSGEVAFITSNSLVGKDTQSTGNIALQIAQTKSGINGDSYNYIFDIKANASEVDGPSAGAAMTLLMYSILSERTLPKDVAITGTINSDSSVGMVGGVYPKAKAASDIGIKLFMIPRGEANQVIRDGGVRSVNLLEYGPEKWGMKIVEVTTIDDVINYAYSDIEEIVVDTTTTSIGFIPPAIKYKSSLGPMEEMSKNYLKRANAVIDEAKKELEVSDLDDEERSKYYPHIGLAERNVEMAKVFLDQNYLYSAANYSFNARVLAGTVEEIAKTPSLLNNESKVLDLKIKNLRREIKILKKDMFYIPLVEVEWLIGAQQRIAYAENALNTLEADTNTELSEEDLFNRVYDYVSASGWFEATKDFFEEAEKSKSKKIVYYSDKFILEISERLIEVEEIINSSSVSDEALSESNRRLGAAKISFDNNFYFAALFDTYFAEGFIVAEQDKEQISDEELFGVVESKIGDNTDLDSLWANLFLDHSKFFLENAEFEGSISREAGKKANLNTSFDWVTLAVKIDEAKEQIDSYLEFAEMDDYLDNSPNVEIKYVKREFISPYLVILSGILVFLLAALILVGFYSNYSKGIKGISRAEKLHLVLNRLDKALSQRKVSDAEYFFMKKKYEDELHFVMDKRAKRSKIALNLDESKAKLNALQMGLHDLKRHYKSGLIIPEDYDRNVKHFTKETTEIKRDIKQLKDDLKHSKKIVIPKESEFRKAMAKQSKKKRKRSPRREKFSKSKKQSEFDVKGTGTGEEKVKGTNK